MKTQLDVNQRKVSAEIIVTIPNYYRYIYYYAKIELQFLKIIHFCVQNFKPNKTKPFSN